MKVGTQFSGTVPGGTARRWFTHSWPAAWHVLWSVVPTTANPGAPQVEWDVSVQRATADRVTYWLTIRNLTSSDVGIQARYAIVDP